MLLTQKYNRWKRKCLDFLQCLTLPQDTRQLSENYYNTLGVVTLLIYSNKCSHLPEQNLFIHLKIHTYH